MTTVALIGADGAGKTSVARQLESSTAVRVRYIYMGANPAAYTHALPTTRLVRLLKRWLNRESHAGGPPDPRRHQPGPRTFPRRVFNSLKSSARLLNQLGEEWYRQWVAWCYQRRGYVVVFDRHVYADYYAHDIRGESRDRSLARRLHGRILDKFYPHPDLTILLDAPADVLFARKSEGTLELVEARRQEYFLLSDVVPHFAVVSADQPLDIVVNDVLGIIREFCVRGHDER